MPFMSAKRSGRNIEDSEARMLTTTTILQLSFLLVALLLIIPTSQARAVPKLKKVVITNNHTNYLSVRCFSFNTDFRPQHLKSMQKYTFSFPVRKIFPSATMFNCSTNLGTFVAYRAGYECSTNEYDTCDWIYDEDRTYHWQPKSERWIAFDYNPNYESLLRGGVIAGYYAN